MSNQPTANPLYAQGAQGSITPNPIGANAAVAAAAGSNPGFPDNKEEYEEIREQVSIV